MKKIIFLTTFLLIANLKAQTNILFDGYSLNFSQSKELEEIKFRYKLIFTKDTSITFYLEEKQFIDYEKNDIIEGSCSAFKYLIVWSIVNMNGAIYNSNLYELPYKYIGKYRKVNLKKAAGSSLIFIKSIKLKLISERGFNKPKELNIELLDYYDDFNKINSDSLISSMKHKIVF